MKIAPFVQAINKYNSVRTPHAAHHTPQTAHRTPHTAHRTPHTEPVNHLLVHTGQHYDDRMSQTFFKELDIHNADINLGVGSGSHAEQVGQTMIEFEKVLKRERPDWVVVVGDVNATLACSVTAKKECIKVCHIEAGLRSGDMSMPEEINRLVTDRLSDLLLAPDRLSIENLKAEGVPDSKIRFVGNIMIDTLEANRHKASQLDINEIIVHNTIGRASGMRLAAGGTGNFAILTIHRPSNVDSRDTFEPIVNLMMDEVTRELVLCWPVHPRARKQLEEFGLWEKVVEHENIILLEPLGYPDMLRMNMEARIVLTDSGGLQEECTVLGTPCLTLRSNTERPVTLKEHGGVSLLVGNDVEKIRAGYREALGFPRTPVRPELWDGHTAERCLEAILGYKTRSDL